MALETKIPFDHKTKSKRRQPRVFVYTIVTDAGFAPNAEGTYLTLATCKPQIRERAQVGDIIIAHHKKARGGRVCYVMVVTETMWQDEYYNDERFQYKIPSATNPTGDNCYHPLANGGYEQLPCQHGACDQEKDLRAPVLISECFTYLGRKSVDAVEEDHELPEWIPSCGRGYRVKKDGELIDYRRTLEWTASFSRGKLGEPTDKPKGRCGGKGRRGGC